MSACELDPFPLGTERQLFKGAIVAAVAPMVLAAAACASHPAVLPGMDIPANELDAATSVSDDEWPTFAHDYTRTGYNAAVTRLNRSTVGRLRLRWRERVGDEVFASPITYAGNVIVATQGLEPPGSVVYDFRASDGRVLWRHRLGGETWATPTIDPDAGLLFDGVVLKQHRSMLFAIRLLDGGTAWSRRLPALVRGAVVTGGRIYIGTAGGDEPLCLQGGVTALDESTGSVVWRWSVDPQPDEGGSVWGAIAYDGAYLIFGTGNTCEEPVPTANGAVALTLDGTMVWSTVAVKGSSYDSDSGGGMMLYDGLAHFINKNGRLYALDQTSGDLVWRTDLNPVARQPHQWNGGFATPSTDGTKIVAGSGLYEDGKPNGQGEFCTLRTAKHAEVFSGFHSKLQGMDMHGRVLWVRKMRNRLIGYVAIAQGVGYVGLNQKFVALDLRNGKTLWTYPTPYYIDASMIVVPSGVYGADDGGNVYAFSLPRGV